MEKPKIRDRYFLSIISCPPSEAEKKLLYMEIKRNQSTKKEPINKITVDLLVENEFRKMAFNGDHGQVLCVGIIVEREYKVTIRKIIGYSKMVKKLIQDEFVILSEFWRILENFDENQDLLVGNNIFDFDLLFLQQRSIIKRVNPRIDFSFAYYRSRPIFDIEREREIISSSDKTRSCEIYPKSNLDNKIIYEYLRAGLHREIAEDCFKRAVLVRQYYRHLQLVTNEHFVGDEKNENQK